MPSVKSWGKRGFIRSLETESQVKGKSIIGEGYYLLSKYLYLLTPYSLHSKSSRSKTKFTLTCSVFSILIQLFTNQLKSTKIVPVTSSSPSSFFFPI